MNRNKIFKIVAASVAGVALGGALIYYNFIDKVKTVEINGDEAPDFTVSTYEVVDGSFTTGGSFTLSEQTNLVVINFWETWCGPCKEELPHFNKLQKNYPGFVEVVVLSSYGASITTPADHTINWLNANKESEAKGWSDFVFTFGQYDVDAYDVYLNYGFTAGVPSTVIVEDGKIVYTKTGKMEYDELETEVLKYLPKEAEPLYPEEEVAVQKKNWWKENALGVTFLAVSTATLGAAIVVSAVDTCKKKKRK